MLSVIRFVSLLFLLAVWLVMGFYWLTSLWDIISTTSEQARINFKVTSVGLGVAHVAVHLMMMRIMAKPTGSSEGKSDPSVHLKPHL